MSFQKYTYDTKKKNKNNNECSNRTKATKTSPNEWRKSRKYHIKINYQIWWFIMSKEKTTINFNITMETKQILDDLKYAEESYDSVLQKLLYFEEKYNTQIDIKAEYELSVDQVTKLIMIRWLNNKYNILYYDDVSHSWSNSASAWTNNNDEDIELLIDKFLSLMAKDDVRPLLIDLDDKLVLDGLTVKRLL